MKETPPNRIPEGYITLSDETQIDFKIKTSNSPDPEKILIIPEIKIRTPNYSEPRDVIFLVDVSGSMKETLEVVKKILTHTILENLHPQDYITLISFSTDYTVHIKGEALSNIKDKLATKINELGAGALTNMHLPLAAFGTDEIPIKKNSICFILTDGDNTIPFLSEHITSKEKLAIEHTPKSSVEEWIVKDSTGKRCVIPEKLMEHIKTNAHLDNPIPLIPLGIGSGYKRGPMKYLSFLSNIGCNEIQVEIHIENDSETQIKNAFEKIRYFLNNPIYLSSDPDFILKFDNHEYKLELGKLWFEGQPQIDSLECGRPNQDQEKIPFTLCLKYSQPKSEVILYQGELDLKNLHRDYDIIALHAERKLAKVLFQLERQLERERPIAEPFNELFNVLSMLAPFEEASKSFLAKELGYKIVNLIKDISKKELAQTNITATEIRKIDIDTEAVKKIKTVSSDVSLSQCTGASMHAGKMWKTESSISGYLPESSDSHRNTAPGFMPVTCNLNLHDTQETQFICM